MLDKLKGKLPENVLNQIPLVMEKFKIDTPLRLAHFLAQCGHESGNFKAVRENLNYSSERLKQIFPKYFPGNMSDLYARKPESIASRVYASRMGNGDEKSRDGWTYRGRGYIQLTGKNNYSAFDAFVDDDIINNPDLVATKYPLLSAAWFFHRNNLNAISDKGSTDKIVTEVTKRVNGGTHGLADRISRFKYFYDILK